MNREQTDKFDVVQFAVKNINENFLDHRGKTALVFAAITSHYKVVQISSGKPRRCAFQKSMQ